MVFRMNFEVQFEDVDSTGVAHHPNYLKWIERARCAWIADAGYAFQDMIKDGLGLAVVEMTLKFQAPLRFGDRARVECKLLARSRSTITLDQRIFLGDKEVFTAELRLVSIDLKNFRPVQLPARLEDAVGAPARG
jgi:acyl-CoA thioester hydrolase